MPPIGIKYVMENRYIYRCGMTVQSYKSKMERLYDSYSIVHRYSYRHGVNGALWIEQASY